MPYQVSWQSVARKSQAPVHVLGADADGVADVVAGAALLAAGSAAHAPLAAPAAARIIAAKMPSFVMAAPCLDIEHPCPKKGSCKTNWRHTQPERENSDQSDRRATASLRWLYGV